MITKLEIQNPNTTTVPHWPKAKGLEGKTVFEFGEGLTVLCGPNGVGKSTLLQVMGDVLMCSQGQLPTVTSSSLGQFKEPVGVVLHHDGAPCGFLHPEERPGLFAGGAAFDDDFMSLGVQSIFAKKQSSGQQSHFFLHSLLGRLLRPGTPALTWKVSETLCKGPQASEHLQSEYQNWQASQKITRTENPIPTLFLDEPDRSLDFPAAAYLWGMLMRLRPDKLQVIATSHSVIPFLYMPRKNLMELSSGYADQCEKAVKALKAGDMPEMWPPPPPPEKKNTKGQSARRVQKRSR